jgi:hypothetical protein
VNFCRIMELWRENHRTSDVPRLMTGGYSIESIWKPWNHHEIPFESHKIPLTHHSMTNKSH